MTGAVWMSVGKGGGGVFVGLKDQSSFESRRVESFP
jgi:hypothetical protein